MGVRIQMQLTDKLFLRDPQDTKLGRNIIQYGIILIDEIGFEQFTFKKLAERINSTEASIYRYFENKHLLLAYLLSWYWEWTRYLIDFNSNNLTDPWEKLRVSISAIVNSAQPNASIDFVDEDILSRIVRVEGIKVYHHKEVDKENQDGLFLTYKMLAARLAEIILEIRPDFPYPRSLASTLLEMSNDHVYFAQHLPRLTEAKVVGNDFSQVEQLLIDFAYGILKGLPPRATNN